MLRTLTILVLLASPALAQPPVRGLAVKVDFALEPTEITLGEDVTLTLTIRNAFNPQQVTRPDLRKLDDFRQRFQITDVPGDPPTPNAPAVKFVYRLRSRESGSVEIPRLVYSYLTPQDRPNTTLTQKGLSITVHAPIVAPPAIVPLEGPEELFTLPRLEELERPSGEVSKLGWILLAMLGPLVSLAWYILWRRTCPDAAMSMKLRRHRAARRALRAIEAAERSDDPARDLATAIRGYLHDRWEWPEEAVTPGEVEAAMAPEGGSRLPAMSDDAVRFLRRCDEVRFAHCEDTRLATDALRLLAEWEQA